MGAPFRFALSTSVGILFVLALWDAVYASPQSNNRFIETSAAVDSSTVDETGLTNGSQESTDDPAEPRVFRHSILVTLSRVAALYEKDEHDFFLGGMYRFIFRPELDIGANLSFSARLGKAYTLDQVRPRFFMQREEKFRGLISLGVDKGLSFSEYFGIYAGLGVGYSFGEYAGTRVDPESAWGVVIDAGLTLRRILANSYRSNLRFGYRFADRSTTEKHAMYVAIGGAW